MAWKLYRWVWQLDSPLHVGIPPAGSLNRTRLYVPAWTLWGALTAEIARSKSNDGFPEYDSVGKEMRESVRLSYLFPAEMVDGEWRAWLPRYKDGKGLIWEREKGGEELEDHSLRMSLLTTRPSTAVNPESDTAEEKSLRETEVINTHWLGKNTKISQVAMVCYVFLKDSALNAELDRVRALLVGGDTRYGLGRLSRIDECSEANSFFGEEVVFKDTRFFIKTSRVLAHTEPRNDKNEPLRGAMECIAGWDMVKGGQKVNGLMWAPGSVSSKFDFTILEEGQWQSIESTTKTD